MDRIIRTDGVELATESFGRDTDPAVLLVMGATASMLGWPDDLCTALAARGHFVIRFDHRDTGRSSTVPPGEAGYAVEDMAGDVRAILDGYALPRAHLVGMSLGGYIAQMLAVTDPRRVATLTLIGSEPLGWDGPPLPQISPRFLDHFGALASLDWADRAAVTEFLVTSDRLCAGPGTPFDEDRARARVARVLSRTDSPASMFNHGTLATRDDWTGRYREIDCPVLVVHGDLDPILPVENGRAIASAVRDGTIVELPRTGHEIPPSLIPQIADRIAGQVARPPG